MAEHRASVVVNAPVEQVYALFSRFEDFPKFMRFVREVTRYDERRSHWVANVLGRREWDAVDAGWIANRQIGWHSTGGLETAGRVTFWPLGADRTKVEVTIAYNPPASLLGDAAERLAAGRRFDQALRRDLANFARMVAEAPPGALDPTSSAYLFRGGAAATGDGRARRAQEHK